MQILFVFWNGSFDDIVINSKLYYIYEDRGIFKRSFLTLSTDYEVLDLYNVLIAIVFDYQHILLYLKCFKKALCPRAVKTLDYSVKSQMDEY